MNQKFKEPENFLVSIKEYRQLKRVIKALEATNYDKIIVATCDGKEGWRDIAEHSALIYYYAVREKLSGKRKSKFMSDDSSFYVKYDIGYMRTKGLNAVRDNLIKLGLYKTERVENKYIHIFELTRTFTEKEIDDFHRKEDRRRLDESLPLDPEAIDPYLWCKLTHLATVLHQKANNNLPKLTAEVNGVRMITLADELLKNYLRASDIEKDHNAEVLAFLKTMQADLAELSLEIKVISATKQWDTHLCVNLIAEMTIIKETLAINIAKLTAPKKPAKTEKLEEPTKPQKPAKSEKPVQLSLGNILDETAKS